MKSFIKTLCFSLVSISIMAFSAPLQAAESHPCFSGGTVKGAILRKYDQLGACDGFLKLPLTTETTTPDGRGRFNHFQGGSIYWTPQTGAHEVHGDILQKWKSLGWERSSLGYPTSDEKRGDNGLRYSNFQGGIIWWTARKGTWVQYHAPQPSSRRTTPSENATPQTSYNDLIVYYNGYTADDVLYIRNIKSRQIQSKPLKIINGQMAAHFTLSPNGGSYEIMKDTCSGKSDCLPVYRAIRNVTLKAKQDKTIRL